MPNKLFIGNLPFSVADAGLSELFERMSIPVASVKIMRDLETGRSRGFGFVELAPEADMESVINQLNGQMLDGRPLTVNEARRQKPREFGAGGGFDRSHNRPARRGGPRETGERRQRSGF